jgi:hypothetical protein
MNNAATCPEGHTTNNRVLSIFAPLARGEAVPVMTMDASAGSDSCCGGSCSCC